MLGILEDATVHVGIAFAHDGDDVLLLGDTFDELGGSQYAWSLHRHLGGVPPRVDLNREKSLCDVLATIAERRLAHSAHDCSEGGLGATLAESAIAGGIGATVRNDTALPAHVWLFSESASRVVVSCDHADTAEVERVAAVRGVPAVRIGRTGGDALVVEGVLSVPVSALRTASTSTLASTLG
jgi:phosphoribosylformylglycinamidine synthase